VNRSFVGEKDANWQSHDTEGVYLFAVFSEGAGTAGVPCGLMEIYRL